MPRKDLATTNPPTEETAKTITLIPEQGIKLHLAMEGDIPGWAIQKREGPGGTMLEYIPHGYVRDQLNEVFGPFWSEIFLEVKEGQKYELIEYDNIRVDQRTKAQTVKHVREIVTMTKLRIRIYSSDGRLISEEEHDGTGGKVWENNITFADALQASQSEALKRAAFPLGRKFGLQLYYDDVERREEWQKKFRDPETFAELMSWIKRNDISDEQWIEITGVALSDVEEKDIARLIEMFKESK